MITVKERKFIQVTRVKTIWEKAQPLLCSTLTEKLYQLIVLKAILFAYTLSCERFEKPVGLNIFFLIVTFHL